MKYASKGVAAALAASMLLGLLPPGISAAAADDGFTLYDGATAAAVYVDTDGAGTTEWPQVVRAAGDLCGDVETVTGKRPQLTDSAKGLSKRAVIAGTLGHSDLIDLLAQEGKLDISGVQGQWEAFTMQVVENPCDGVEQALVIAGSDKRGAIYGLYELSAQIGVSPWTWWGDVPAAHKDRVVLAKAQIEKTEKPDVKYRGIFLNDEENFEYWSRLLENDTDSPGTPNANTYAKVFELLLRLKANTLWPAMHEQSDAFNKYLNPATGVSYNAEKADEYGIVMGTSHCEMLLRNNASEWTPWCEANVGKYNLQKVDNNWSASYDYTVNPQAMEAYWEEAVARNYKFDNMYVIGLRGVHDGSINCKNLADKSAAGRAGVVKKAIEAQVRIVEKYEQKYAQETGEQKNFLTVYCSYKEAAEYFQYDISLPEDTVIIWGDDNYGYVREVSTAKELEKYPNAGVYYHVSYLGAPLSYLWVASTPLEQIYAEMSKSYNAGSDDCWILNVGDLKPAEVPMEFFLTMAWDFGRYTDETVDDFYKMLGKRDFGLSDADAAALAEVLAAYYQVADAKKPEFFGKSVGTSYSAVEYGDEAQRQLNRMAEAEAASARIYESLPAERKDAYYQMAHYMVRALKLTLEKHIYEQKNQLYARQGRLASVNAYGQAALDAYSQILADLKYYNKTVSGGRWDGILDPYNGTRGLPAISAKPNVVMLSEESAVEGIGSVCEGQSAGTEDITLQFDSLNDQTRFIDVFNTGLTAASYRVQASSGLTVARADGSVHTGAAAVEVEERLRISVDWSRLPAGESQGSIVISDDKGYEQTYPVKLTKAEIDPAAQTAAGHRGYYEIDGQVSIEAEHYSKNVTVNGQSWQVVRGLGRGTDVMKCFPDLSGDSVRIDANYETASPYLEYEVYFTNTGKYDLSFYRLPTLNEGANKSNRTAFQFDGGEVYLFRGNSKVDNEHGNAAWRLGVVDHVEVLKHSVTVSAPGWHAIRIYKCDAGAAFDKIVLQQTVKSSLLGAPETFNTAADYQAPAVGMPPVFALSDITYGDDRVQKSFLFDFRADPAGANEGYLGVDNKTVRSVAGGYAWDADTLSGVKAYTRTANSTSARDNGFVSGNATAGFTVLLSEPGQYVVGLAIGDRQTAGVAAKNMKVTANGKELFSGFSLTAGRTVEKGFVVDVTGSQLRLEFSGDSWTLAALEVAPYNPPPKNDGTGVFVPDGKGDINIEAEAALEQSAYAYSKAGTDPDNSSWMESFGSSGTGMYCGPNKGNQFTSTNINENKGPKLFYQIDFARAGSYDVWVLVKTQADVDDSIQVSLDGGAPVTLNDTKNTGGAFRWVKVPSQISVSAAGLHTFSVWEREDGFLVDKIVLTQGAGPSGLGGKMCREGGSVDRSALNALIEEAEKYTAGEYLPDSFAVLQTALQAARGLSASAGQSQVDAALSRLQQALDGLMKKSVLDADVTDGLVAQYTFEGNWKNSLNRDETATAHGSSALAQEEGRGQVAKVGGGSRVAFPNPLYGQALSDGLTISFWAKGDTMGDYECLWSASDNINFVWLAGGPYFGYSGSRGYIDMNKPDNVPGATDKLRYLQTGRWYHLTTTITESEAVVYVNGKPFLSTADPNYTAGYNPEDLTRVLDLLRQARTIQLGATPGWWGSANFYADDFTLYDRALTADQAAKLSLNAVDKTPLLEAIEKARTEAAKTDLYLPDSIAAYEAEIQKAEGVLYNTAVTDGMIAKAVADLEAAKGLLKTKSDEDKAAAAVDALIAALPAPEELTEADAEQVAAARKAYAALTEYGQSKVTKLDILLAAEERMAAFNNQAAIRNLVCHDGANRLNWVVRTNAQEGVQAYSDRTITFRQLPDTLKGRDWIRTAMNSKLWNGGEYLCEFDVTVAGDIYVGLDEVVPRPDWLGDAAGFQRTEQTVVLNGTDSILRLYRRAVTAGEHVKLGYVGMDRACYLVFADHVTAQVQPEKKPQKNLSQTLKVACVGDSITYGSGASDRDQTCYPPQLQKLLGESYDVRNFGLGGTTMMNSTDKPYTAQQQFADSKSFLPDIVIIMLGTNDSKPKNSGKLDAEYKRDALALIDAYKNLRSKPKVYIATSPYVMGHKDNPGSNDIVSEVVADKIVPLQREIARETGCELIDVFAATAEQSIFPDNVHPNDEGYQLIADVFYTALFDYLPDGVQEITDRSALDALMAACAGLKEADYTPASWQLLQKALEDAGQLPAEASQVQIDQAAAAIESAKKNLQPAANIIPGDMDKNGNVTIQDVMEACKVLARQSAGKAPTADEMARGNLDGDDKFSIGDVMEICKILARKA
ncbi:MAG: hypothetical protein HFE86_04790 [Clostridiales bacterium]|nr:hypothetical protein [Clostridiales bacterium]